MFLKSPTSGDNPKSNRSQKGAFTNKMAPKIKKFEPKGEGEEGEDDAQVRKPAPKEKQPDSAFVVWLRNKPTSHAVHVDMAKDYLLEGQPFKGDSAFDAKDCIKERGGAWCPNTDKRKDCEDKSIRRGWWSAPNEVCLMKLLRMPNNERSRRQWTPLNMGPTQINCIVQWLDEFHGNVPGSTTQEELVEEARVPLDHESAPKRARMWVATWVPDTKCIVCGQPVTDQFMDCHCLDAEWERCTKCGEKYRIDFRVRKDVVRNANAWCKCGRR